MIDPDVQPIAHHPPRPRIETSIVWPVHPVEPEPWSEVIAKQIRDKMIWKYLEQAAEGCGE